MEETTPEAACAKCGSNRVMVGLKAVSADGGNLSVRLVLRGFLRLHTSVDSTVKARVCAHCGYTEFYATNLDKLWEAYGI